MRLEAKRTNYLKKSDRFILILSNGFKLRVAGGNNNASGDTIIVAAFAESPFKVALAR